MRYEIELVFEDRETLIAYLCDDGVRIALLYTTPRLIGDDADDINHWQCRSFAWLLDKLNREDDDDDASLVGWRR